MMDGDTNKKQAQILAILTLERHKDGIWIQRLVQCLQQLLLSSEEKSDDRKVKVKIIALEEYMSEPFCVSESEYGSNHMQCQEWMGLVNRVSDAAAPWEVKACMALLQIARHVWNIPIVNGPDAYGLCTSKWCHHLLFAKAKLASPVTIAAMQQESKLSLEKLKEKTRQNYNNNGATQESDYYLIKPNAGGFGAGIVQQRGEMQPEKLPVYADRMMLLQKYVPPKYGQIYRTWFLQGKVQCAMERRIPDDSNSTRNETSPSEFTSGCAAGGACTWPNNKKQDATTNNHSASSSHPQQPWTIPEDVRREIEDQLLPLLPNDATCGSVEFLYNFNGNKDETGSESQQRLYFDLNLLSTLPVESTDHDTDPWLELANAILEVTGCPNDV